MIDIYKYLGKWYEIATIPHGFQYGMKNVTAEYSLNENGTIKVVNSGYLDGELKQITGVAKITDSNDILKVSFYPNTYSDYKILAVVLGSDGKYEHALVGGETKYSLWVLSRKPDMNKSTFDRFVDIAKKYDYKVDKLKITD